MNLNNLLSQTDPNACGKHGMWNRRGILKTAGLAGLSWLTPLSGQLALAAEKSGKRPRSVIVLWLQGGASQLESFDPHPGKKIAYGGKAVDTAQKGVQFAEGYEQTAEVMQDLSVIRSLNSKEGDHARAMYNIKTGHRPLPGLVHPSLGAIICHEMPELKLDIPTHISILSNQFPARGGYMGAKYDAFKIGDPVNPVPDISSWVDKDRQDSRLKSLDLLEASFSAGRLSKLDEDRTLHQTNVKRALNMMSSDQLAAFDVKQATEEERDGYGDSAFGRGCLTAVRLVEAGVRCVEVTLNGWDTHANNQEFTRKNAETLDPAIASLMKSLKERDLYDETIVLVGTEFGRTPKQNGVAGRDHWPHGFSVLLGGGGIAGGRVIGETDPEGEKEEASDKVTVDDLHATIHKALGIDSSFEMMTPLNRPIPLSEGNPVRKLLET